MEDEIDYTICPKCNGVGLYEHKITKDKISYTEKSYCNKCGGSGMIDWLQQIIPEKPYWRDDGNVFEDFYSNYDPYGVDYYDGYEDLPYWWEWDDYDLRALKTRDAKKNKKKLLKKRVI